MKISAVVVTYNRVSKLKACIKYLLTQNYNLESIFVINNASTDNTNNYLGSIKNSKIIPINMKKNVGGAGGFSAGLNAAFTRSNSSYFWIMDDDSMPSKDALKSLVKGVDKLSGHFGFLSSNVRWIKNNEPTNIPMVADDWSELASKSLIKLKEATFVSILIPRNVVQQLGLPIAKEFIWCDDTEYTYRISRKFPCYFVPNSIVYHNSQENSNNENIFNDSYGRIKFYRFGYRNKLFMDKKYFSIKRFLIDFLKMFISLFKIPFLSKSHRLLRMRYTLIGLITGIFFNPNIQFPSK